MDHWNTRKRVHDEDDDNEDRSECWKRSRLQSADSPASGSPATASPRNWSTLSFLNTGAASWMNTDIIGEVKNQIAQDKDSNNVTRSPSHSSTSSAASSFGISDLKRLGMSSFLSNINVNKHSPNHPSTSSATLGISEFNKKGTSSFLNTSFVPWSQSDICQQLKQSCSSNLFSSEQVNKSPQAVDSDDMDICSSVSDSPTPTRPPLPEESPPAPPTPPPPAPPPLSPLPPPPSLSAFPALNSVSKNYFDSSPKLASNSTLLPPPLLPRLLAELAHSDISLSPPSHLPHVAEHDNKSPPQSPPQPAEHSVDSDSVLTPLLCSSHQSGEVDHDSALSAAVLHQSAPMSHHHIEEHDKELSPSPTFSHTEDDMKHKMLPTVFPQSEEYDSNSIPSSSSPIDEQFPQLTTENDTVFSPEPTLCHELVADDKNFEPVTLPSDSEVSSPLPISTTPIPQQLPNISEDSNSLTIIATYIPQQLPKFSEDSNSLITTASPMPQQLPKLSEDSSSLTITTPPDQLPELEEANYPLTVTFLPLTHPSPTISEDKSPLTSDQLSQIAAENSPLTSSPVTDPSPKISVEDEIDSKLTHESPGSNVLEENAMPPSTSPPEPTVEGETYLSKEDGDFQDESPPKLSASPDKIISEGFASTSDKDEIKQVPLLQENIDSDVQSIKNIDETKNPDEDNKEEETENERSSSALKTIERINELQVMPSHSYKDGCNFMKAFPPRPVDAERLISNIPSYWITAKDPGTFLSSYLTVGIPTCSEEYQYVLNKFIGVLPCSILAIDRVENPYTLFNYELRKEELLKYGVDFMEFHLFHGTSIENLVSIMETNFDWTRYGTNVGSKFGQGVSFTPNASYAVHYTDKSLELNVIILTRVIVSKFCLGDTSNILPPVGYDTTISPTGKVWVKYNNDEFYPDYLVYFKLNDMTWFEKAEQPMHPSEAIKFFNHQAETLYMAPRFPGPSHPDESHPQEDFTSDNFVYTPEHNRRKTPENPPELDARSSQQKTSVRGSKARRCSRRPVRTRARKRDLPRYSVESPESHQRSPEFIPGNNPMRLSPPMPLMANNPFISNQHVNVPSISPPNQFHFNHPGIGRHPDEPFIFRGNQGPHLSPPDPFNRPEMIRHVDGPFMFRGNQGPHLSPPDPFNRPEMIRHPDEPFMFRGNQGPHLSPPDPFNRPEMIRHANEPFIFRGNQGPGIPHLSPPHPFNRSEMVRHVDEPFNFRGNQGPGIPHLSPPDPFNRSEMIRHVDEPFNFRGNQGPGIPHLSPPDHPGFSGGIQRHPNDPFVFHGSNQGPEMPHRFSPPDQFQFNRPGDGRLLPHHENQSFNFPGINF